jgi:valine--pyruvate aminotransferase
MMLSNFGKRFTGPSGALELMDDMGQALAAGDSGVMMLGGGNPGRIPAMRELFMQRLGEVAADPDSFDRMFANYSPPAGDLEFRRNLARLLKSHCGFDVDETNIALTTGSQFSFFLLFNLLGGVFPGGEMKRILLPVTPEYIGYKDQGLVDNLFTARRSTINELPDSLFKYRVDFDNLPTNESLGAICVSRPTNPTGNVITDRELARLDDLAKQWAVPLIVDAAYGQPFPGMNFVNTQPIWNDNIILCLSLSKLGLPGIRTGIVIARPDIARAISSCTAVMNLSVPSVGAVLLDEWVASGKIIELGETHIKPFYEHKAMQTLDALRDSLQGYPLRVHKPEGAMFLWVWFPGLPIHCKELYARLKHRQVLVIPGHHFFPGLDEPWQHGEECLRVSYAQDQEAVTQGIGIIAEEVKRAFDEAAA